LAPLREVFIYRRRSSIESLLSRHGYPNPFFGADQVILIIQSEINLHPGDAPLAYLATIQIKGDGATLSQTDFSESRPIPSNRSADPLLAKQYGVD
jgi:hypothetical protein